MVFLDQYDADDAACRTVGGEKRLVGLGDRLAVQSGLDCLPSAFLSGPFRQADPLLAILFWRQIEKCRVASQPANDNVTQMWPY